MSEEMGRYHQERAADPFYRDERVEHERLTNLELVAVGEIAVDSGEFLIVDPGYIKYLPLQLGVPLTGDDDCDFKSFNFAGVAFGLGDGCWPVTATYADVPGIGRRIVKVEIDTRPLKALVDIRVGNLK
jgi:hypothetical protein